MKNPETIGNLIDRQKVSVISSVDENSFPNTKVMLPPCKREGLRTFYWHTNSSSMRVTHYRNNPKTCVYFYDKRFFQGVMLKGYMEVVDDAHLKRELWKDGYEKYYSGGVDGGDYILLRFTAEEGRCYANFHSEDFKI